MQGNTSHQKMEVPSSTGRKEGLQLVLDLHSNQASLGTITGNYAAFEVFLGQPSEFPLLTERSIQLEPGREHSLELGAQVLSSTGVRELAPEDRRCFYPDEGDLHLYSRYTFTNCRFECGMREVEGVLGCVPWFLPQVLLHPQATPAQGNHSRPCDPWTARTFTRRVNAAMASSACNHCLPDCESVTYSVLPTSATIRSWPGPPHPSGPATPST